MMIFIKKQINYIEANISFLKQNKTSAPLRCQIISLFELEQDNISKLHYHFSNTVSKYISDRYESICAGDDIKNIVNIDPIQWLLAGKSLTIFCADYRSGEVNKNLLYGHASYEYDNVANILQLRTNFASKYYKPKKPEYAVSKVGRAFYTFGVQTQKEINRITRQKTKPSDILLRATIIDSMRSSYENAHFKEDPENRGVFTLDGYGGEKLLTELFTK